MGEGTPLHHLHACRWAKVHHCTTFWIVQGNDGVVPFAHSQTLDIPTWHCDGAHKMPILKGEQRLLMALHSGVTTIDTQGGGGNEGCLVTGEEEHRIGHL